MERHRDDQPKHATPPRVPPGTKLDALETELWNWCMEHICVPHVHGSGDAVAFGKLVKLWARVIGVDAKIAEQGVLMKSPRGRPEQTPYTRLSSRLWHEIGIALSEVGGNPSSRVRLAGPRVRVPLGDSASWDTIE